MVKTATADKAFVGRCDRYVFVQFPKKAKLEDPVDLGDGAELDHDGFLADNPVHLTHARLKPKLVRFADTS